MASIPTDWLDFIDCLNGQGVEYVIVGAHALAFHELPRLTGDMDFLVRPTPENSVRVVAAYRDFGFGSLGLKDDEFASLDRIVQIGYPPVRIDVMSSISGVAFDEVWATRIFGDLGGREVFFMGREALLKNKIASGRPKDMDDAKRLSRLIKQR